MATGRTAAYDTDAPGKIGFFLFPSAEEGGVHGSMGVPTTFGIAANAKHADCAAFFLELGGDRSGRSPDHRARRRIEPGRTRRPAAAGCARGLCHDRDAPGGQAAAAENGVMDFIANATGTIFTDPGLDDGAPEDGRRSADG